jgi:hypothetical protein
MMQKNTKKKFSILSIIDFMTEYIVNIVAERHDHPNAAAAGPAQPHMAAPSGKRRGCLSGPALQARSI